MKRRGFLKGLLSVPIVGRVVSQTLKEEPKPERAKPPEPQPRVSVRIPKRQGAVSAWSETLTVGEDGYFVWEMDIPGK